MDMYGEKVADASALIRQVSGKEYFDAFGVSTESVLELFIDCMEQVRKVEREVQASRIADLERENARLDAALDEEISTRDQYHEWADRLAAEIARYFGVDIGEHSNANNPWEQAYEAVPVEASAPAIGKLIGIEDMCKILDAAHIKSTEYTDCTILYTVTFEQLRSLYMKGMAFAPQAADTDKVRQVIRDVAISTSGSKGYAKAFNDGAETMREAIAGVFDDMAAQAPVRDNEKDSK